MRALRKVYAFVTGGSVASPLGLACGIALALVFPRWRPELLTGCIALGFVASTFEREA